MRQFQGSLGPIQDLQPKRDPRPPTLQKIGSSADSGRRKYKFRADPETALTVLILVVSALLVVIGARFVKELL